MEREIWLQDVISPPEAASSASGGESYQINSVNVDQTKECLLIITLLIIIKIIVIRITVMTIITIITITIMRITFITITIKQ